MNSADGSAAADGHVAGLRSPHLIGRGRELELLVEAAITPPSVVVVEGEAGIGKTRLVDELLTSASLLSPGWRPPLGT
jgi:MoxR-like ATPase